MRGLLSKAEIGKLRDDLETNTEIGQHVHGRSDGQDRKINMCLWNHAGNDLTGVIARYIKKVG